MYTYCMVCVIHSPHQNSAFFHLFAKSDLGIGKLIEKSECMRISTFNFKQKEEEEKYRSLLSIFNAKTHFAIYFRRECLSQR